MKYFSRLLRVGLWLVMGTVCASASGQAVDCVTRSSPATDPDDQPDCASVYSENGAPQASRWSVGLTLGYGERENPLINRSDDTLYGFLQLSYFGERFFFDNGDFGWALSQSQDWSVNLIGGIGGERSFFSFFDDEGGFGPQFTPGELGSAPLDVTEEQRKAIQTPDRDRSIDAGIELIHDWRTTEIMIQLLTDVSGRHEGQEAWLSWAKPLHFGRWTLVPSTGLVWKSGRNTDYYFGVRPQEVQPGLPAYRANAALNPFIRLSMRYDISAHWNIVSVLRYERLDDEITNSPMVVDDAVTTAFIGLSYAF